jgi:hypothetical protein
MIEGENNGVIFGLAYVGGATLHVMSLPGMRQLSFYNSNPVY